MSRSSGPAELPLAISRDVPESIPTQLAEQLRAHILAGTLAPADALPSTRALAARLDIARGSVVAAYEQLSAEGYLETSKGGTRVTKNLKLQEVLGARSGGTQPGHLPRSQQVMLSNGEPLVAGGGVRPPRPPVPPRNRTINLTPGSPDTSLLASTAWRASWRVAAAEPTANYGASGSPALQYQLAEHLRTMRHTVCAPHEIMVTAGARDGFRLLLSSLRTQRRERPLRIAVENPGYPSLYQIPAVFGHEIIPVRVDQHGLDPASLPAEAPDLVLVAPSHQYPLGASMPVTRRLELLDWARENNAYIVEDDYDSELRYVGDALPALTALSRQHPDDRTIMLGSFSKTLTPALGLGFMLAPVSLHTDILRLRRVMGNPVSALTQDAATHFFARGGAHRHIARMRRVYRQRRETLVTALAQSRLPDWVNVLPMDGGLHLVLEFTGVYASAGYETLVCETLMRSGVEVAALGDYWAHAALTSRSLPPTGTDVPSDAQRTFGVVLGFGVEAPHRLQAAAQKMTQVLDSMGVA
ncbi:PLP-dependent aminotransferase family protein [Rothia sp. ZJ932]|uniref:MocR-like pyridoxine biosynthesis transcription factor PdxR n=1 Tax=Rothia sp. ZJ932 TaxID=2810516 RepID=UPI001967E5B7|nr:PLP-dependent aminotransferase family protein [Rothia sp. ZJ932]QRZ61650.1 PLP-dependent aminotransferase family protein [Rothia sp. ZJ932]